MRLGDFEVYRELLMQQTGVDIEANKTFLLESRLSPVVRKWGYPTIESMTLALRGVPEPSLIDDIVQAMTSSETWFFRDPPAYETLEHIIIPYFLRQRRKKKTIRLWSAGCSRGQETWSMAMSAAEGLGTNTKWNLDILGTDISSESIAYAERGIYSPHEAQSETSIRLLIKYFEQSRIGWNVKDTLKNHVRFQVSNLLHETEDFGAFDVIFCCNLLGEFNPEARQQVLVTLANQLADDGFLFISPDGRFDDQSGVFTALPGHPHILILADGDYKFNDLSEISAKISA